MFADTALSRMIGLLKRDQILPGEALIIPQCRSIHMFFMKFCIDVIFVDKHNCVIGLVENIKPYQLSPIFWRAACAIEIPVKTIVNTHTAIGDIIKWGQ